MLHPQTIQIFLPAGDPQGIRVAAITTRIVQVIEVPRVRLDDFLKMPEAESVGIYVLFGEDDETGAARAYIGQTGNFGVRLKQHNDKKDFWDRALVALSLTRSLTVTHAYFLEWLSISRALNTQRFMLENGTAGSRPYTPAPMEAECFEIFETVDVLLTTLGYPLFKPLIRQAEVQPVLQGPGIETAPVTPGDQTAETVDLYCRTADGVAGCARYTEEGLVVLRGSRGRLNVHQPFYQHHYYPKRQALIDEGLLAVEGEQVVFTRDVLFKNPSPGAVFLLGRAANGWTEWKDGSGQTLASLTGRHRPSEASEG